MKSPEYVAAVTGVYRKAIDEAIAGRAQTASDEDRYALEMTFSRGLSSGWLEGTNHPLLTHGRFGKKRGAFVGQVDETGRDWVALDHLHTGVKPGDGIVFDVGGDTDREQGGFVFDVHGTQLGLQRGKIDTREIPVGAKVWKTSDPALEKRLRKSWSAKLERRRDLVDFEVRGRVGEMMTLSIARLGLEVESSMALEPAPQTSARRGGAGEAAPAGWAIPDSSLATVHNRLEGDVMLPMSELNRMAA